MERFPPPGNTISPLLDDGEATPPTRNVCRLRELCVIGSCQFHNIHSFHCEAAAATVSPDTAGGHELITATKRQESAANFAARVGLMPL